MSFKHVSGQQHIVLSLQCTVAYLWFLMQEWRFAEVKMVMPSTSWWFLGIYILHPITATPILGAGTRTQDLLLFLLNIICCSLTLNHKLGAITSILWITTHQLWPWLTAINKGLSHEWMAAWTDFSFSGFPCQSHCSKFCHWFHSFLVHVHTVNSPGAKNTSFISMRPLCWCIIGAARG